MTTALLADDEPHLAQYLREQLSALWPALEIVAVARNGVEAAAQIEALNPDLAFLDIRMPGLTGLEVAQGIEGATRVVFVTAFDQFVTSVRTRLASVAALAKHPAPVPRAKLIPSCILITARQRSSSPAKR